EDVTPDYTCYALQGPRSTEVLEALTGESWRDLKFSRFRKTQILGTETIVGRQGVTGEIGYEFLMRTESGHAHELWRKLREVGRDFGLRELGFKAQLIGHAARPAVWPVPGFVFESSGRRLGLRLCVQPDAAAHDLARAPRSCAATRR